jgi:hypothetical protein
MLPGSDDDGFPAEDRRSGPRALSHRQIAITIVLTGILLIVGIVLLVTKAQGSSSKTITPVSGAGTTASGPGTLPIGSSHSGSAVALELSLRSKLGGCWDDAEPGGADGAYRQDFHFAAGLPCGGQGWDIDVELFDSNGQAAAAGARSSQAQSTYREGNMLVLVGPAADASTRTAVASQPGLSRVSPQ